MPDASEDYSDDEWRAKAWGEFGDLDSLMTQRVVRIGTKIERIAVIVAEWERLGQFPMAVGSVAAHGVNALRAIRMVLDGEA